MTARRPLRPRSRTALFLLPLFAFVLASVRAAEPLPNVIVILADDLGYGDLGCYGSTTIATPRLDRLAREGLRFTDAYAAAPFCSPSRAALLTGRLPARCGLPYVLFPTEHHGLPAGETTIAELLQTRGYATACIGKWHLGWDAPFRPLAQGFDRFHGLPHTNDVREWRVGDAFTQLSMFAPLARVEGERVVESPVDQAELTRHYTEEAVAFIRANRERPFFLYLPHTMPHVPQYASPRFAGKSRGASEDQSCFNFTLAFHRARRTRSLHEKCTWSPCARACFPPKWSARCLREWSRTSIRTASGATANGQGRRAVLRRPCIEPRSSLWGGTKHAAVQRERRARRVQRVHSDSSGLLRVPRMPHAPPQVLPHLTLGDRLSAP